jgi:hypothetical protein
MVSAAHRIGKARELTYTRVVEPEEERVPDGVPFLRGASAIALFLARDEERGRRAEVVLLEEPFQSPFAHGDEALVSGGIVEQGEAVESPVGTRVLSLTDGSGEAASRSAASL